MLRALSARHHTHSGSHISLAIYLDTPYDRVVTINAQLIASDWGCKHGALASNMSCVKTASKLPQKEKPNTNLEA